MTAALVVTVAAPAVPGTEPIAPRPVGHHSSRRAVTYGGLAVGFATVGLGLAVFRGWNSHCAEWESESDCEATSIDVFYAVMQTVANMHALAFAGASSGMVGRWAHDSRRTRVRLAVGGAASLTLGAMFGAASYALILASPRGNDANARLVAGRALIGEAGAAAAITGVVLLARVVAQQHKSRNSRVAFALMPSRGGASLTLGGVF
jgi:hypothetical protein